MHSSYIVGLLLLAMPLGVHAAPKDEAAVTVDVRELPATGETRQCLAVRDVQQTRIVGKETILFRTGANRWFRNDLKSPCPGLRDDRILVFRASAGSICEMDVVDIVDGQSRINHGFCGLGRFTPVALPKGAKLAG